MFPDTPKPVSFRGNVIRWSILMALVVIGVVVYLTPVPPPPPGLPVLSVTFFDVGQGDAIFIQSPTGTQMLIDGGRPGAGILSQLSETMGFFDRSLDVVLATHPDKHHIRRVPACVPRPE